MTIWKVDGIASIDWFCLTDSRCRFTCRLYVPRASASSMHCLRKHLHIARSPAANPTHGMASPLASLLPWLLQSWLDVGLQFGNRLSVKDTPRPLLTLNYFAYTCNAVVVWFSSVTCKCYSFYDSIKTADLKFSINHSMQTVKVMQMDK